MGPMQGLTAQEVKDYIRFIGNRRLSQLGLEPIYKVEKNPLTWLDTMLNAVEHMNFFEGRVKDLIFKSINPQVQLDIEAFSYQIYL